MKNVGDLSFGKYLAETIKKNNITRAKLIKELNNDNGGKEHKVAICRIIQDDVGEKQLNEIKEKLFKLRINGVPLKLFEENDRSTVEKACNITLTGKDDYVSDNLLKKIFIDSEKTNSAEKSEFLKIVETNIADGDVISEILLLDVQEKSVLHDVLHLLKANRADSLKIYHLLNLYETASEAISAFGSILKLLLYQNNYFPFTFQLSSKNHLNNFLNKIYVKTTSGFLLIVDMKVAIIRADDLNYSYIESEYEKIKTSLNRNFEKLTVEYFEDKFERVFPKAIESASNCYTSDTISEYSYSYQICLGNLYIVIPEILSEKIRKAVVDAKSIEEYDRKMADINSKLTKYNMKDNGLFSGQLLNTPTTKLDIHLYFTIKGLKEFTDNRKPYGYEITDDIFSRSSGFDQDEMKTIIQKLGYYVKESGNKESKVKIHIIDNDEKRNKGREFFDFPEKFNISIVNTKHLLIEHFEEESYWMLKLSGCKRIQEIFEVFLQSSLKDYCLTTDKAIEFLNSLLDKVN